MTIQNSTAALDRAAHLHPYTNARKLERDGPRVISRGKGIFVYDEQGTEYIEGLAGLWSVAVGFGEERLQRAAVEQMAKLPYYHVFAQKTHGPAARLADRIVEITPKHLTKVFFTNSGSEANDTVVKLIWFMNNALGRPAKKKFIARANAYHGITVASGSLTGLPWNHRSFDLPAIPVLVTGASRGIGAAIARGFAQVGARVAIHYNASAAPAEELAQRIIRDGGTAVTVAGDFSQPDLARAVVASAANKLGDLHVLINNAGSMIDRRSFMDVDDDLITAVNDLNLRSLIAASQAAVPHMEKAGRGAIVNLGSIAGANGGSASVAHYAAAKGYVHTLTRSMAMALAPKGVRVNAIAPGVINTDFHAATPPDILANLKSAIVMGRLGVAEDCVGPTLFLSSNALSGYITGQVLHINGGQYMG